MKLSHHRRKFLHLAAGAAALPVASRIAKAQAYPARPVTIVVPFAAGGPTDTIARVIAQRMRQSLGQTVIIENVTGAAGSIGVGRVARAAPDGYTISIGHWSTHVVNGAIYQLAYDVLNDFEPISLVASNPQLIVAKKTFPPNDLIGLIDWLKANPDKASEGTAGAGSASHVSGIYFQKGHRHDFSICALSRHRSCDAGFGCWTDRHHVRPSRQLASAGSQWERQGLCRHRE